MIKDQRITFKNDLDKNSKFLDLTYKKPSCC